ncbi:unnamed protein product [Malus baccata var. baccata]
MEKRLDAKFDLLLQRILGSQVVVQQPLQAACSICNMITHDFMSCPHKDVCSEFKAKQVQQYAAPKATWEVAIDKLANTTTQEIQNLQVAMKSMEKQIGQITLQVSERAPGTFPSQTEPNPRGGADCKAVRVSCFGKFYDNRLENCVRNSQVVSQPNTYSGNVEKSDNLKDFAHPLSSSKNSANIVAECVYEPPMPYPERLKPKVKDQHLPDFMKTLSKVQINLPLIDAIKNIPSYAKFLKDVCTKKKKLVDFEKRLRQGEIKPTSVILQLADHSVAYPRRIIEDVIIKVDNLYLPTYFVILDMDEDMQTPIILGRLFMANARTLIDVKAETLTLRVQDQSVVFILFEATKRPVEVEDCMSVDVLDNLIHVEIMPPLENVPFQSPRWMHVFESLGEPKKLLQPSKVHPPKLELKELPEHLKYAYLGADSSLPVIIAADLSST